MAVKVGDHIPDVQVHLLGEDGMPQPVSSASVLGTGKVVMFAVPGAFTPGCSKVHLPGYVQHGAELKAKGVDKIVCVSINDPWVMDAWAQAQGAKDIVMVGDGAGAFTKAMGLEFDGAGFGLGMRSQRYSALIDNGVIKELNVEAGPGIDVSACEVMLKKV
jgi:peroxiredoxin